MSSSAESDESPNPYRQLGVRTWINAAGTHTYLGGSLMAPEAVAAWNAAAAHFVDLNELHDVVGQRIAELLGVEAAMVTAGAASALTLGTAAAVTLKDPAWALRCTDDGETRWQVLVPHGPYDPYRRQLAACGVQLVVVDSLAAARAAIGPQTVLLFASNVNEPTSCISHDGWVALGRDCRIPLLLDAAADVPPVANLTRLRRLGYDLVAISGGKAIRGPQDTGLLLGRADLIAAARRNASPHEGTLGRSMKVSKEDAVALWTALQQFVAHGDDIGAQCDRRLAAIQRELEGLRGVALARVVPPVANRFPHLKVCWDEAASPLTVDQVRRALREGDPPIATEQPAGVAEPGLYIAPLTLRPGEELVVARRLRDVLQRPLQASTASPSAG